MNQTAQQAGLALLLGVGTALLLNCNGPIVARSPEALYALATEQIANANYSPAVDTLTKVMQAPEQTEWAGRAQVLRIALLAGMARGFKEIAENYLAGHQQAGAAAYAPQMRAIAMDYFGRARGRSIEMVEALDRMMREPGGGPVRVELSLPPTPATTGAALAKVRQGNWIENPELVQAEKDQVREQLGQALTSIAGADAGSSSAAFYLAVGREIVNLSGIYRPEALRDARMFRLFYERAATAASRAGELAREAGNRKLEEESQQLLAHCKEALKRQ
ncbi:MAG TPA: hypothetical protein VJ085_07025 [Candidatus Acidoferrales bacterium]|nr:hypothetical protein [Candidatus Acidoferrales bacterium]